MIGNNYQFAMSPDRRTMHLTFWAERQWRYEPDLGDTLAAGNHRKSAGKEPTVKGESSVPNQQKVSRKELIALLNEDLAGEYQAIISYVVYSQVLKGAEYMNIAGELEKHAGEELGHALIISNLIDYLGGMPVVTPKPVRTSEKAKEMLQFDLENENETIRRYRARVRQAESLNEFAMAEQIREILIDEQDHQIALATALGIDTPEV